LSDAVNPENAFETFIRVLDKDKRVGIFYKTSLIPVPGSGGTDSRGVLPGESRG